MWKLIFKNKQVEICCQLLSLESELSNEHKIEGLVRKAASTTGALQLQERQNIQKEQSLLQQKVEKLRTKTKKVVAEEKLQFQSVNSPSLSLPGEVRTSPPQETKQSDKVNDSQILPITETNLSPLNPEAPEWQGSGCLFLHRRQTSKTHINGTVFCTIIHSNVLYFSKISSLTLQDIFLLLAYFSAS